MSRCDNETCSTCARYLECVWCEIKESNTSFCVIGSIIAPSTNFSCTNWYYGQCLVSGSFFPAIYLCFVGGVAILIIVILIIGLILKNKGSCSCCDSLVFCFLVLLIFAGLISLIYGNIYVIERPEIFIYGGAGALVFVLIVAFLQCCIKKSCSSPDPQPINRGYSEYVIIKL